MWVFLNDAFLSIVASDQEPSKFAVRARQKQDLLNAFPGCKPIKGTKDQDYAWRIFIDRQAVRDLVDSRLADLDYTNFKGSIPDTVEGEERHEFYLAVWQKALNFQNGVFRSRFIPKADRAMRNHGFKPVQRKGR